MRTRLRIVRLWLAAAAVGSILVSCADQPVPDPPAPPETGVPPITRLGPTATVEPSPPIVSTPAPVAPVPAVTPEPTRVTTPAEQPASQTEEGIVVGDLVIIGPTWEMFGYTPEGAGTGAVRLKVTNRGSEPSEKLLMSIECDPQPGLICIDDPIRQPIPGGGSVETDFHLEGRQGEVDVAVFVRAAESDGTHRDIFVRDLSVDIPHRRPVDLRLGVEAMVLGYWSDGGVDLRVTASLQNDGYAPSNEPELVSVICRHAGEVLEGCGGEIEIPFTQQFGLSQETLDLALPTGHTELIFELQGKRVYSRTFEAPDRILGVDRDVWECFRDTSLAGTHLENEYGVGCAGWTRDFVVKWGGKQLDVWVSGPESWLKEYNLVLKELLLILGLEFEYVDDVENADLAAFIGVPRTDSGAPDDNCPGGSLGCAEVKVRDENKLYDAKVRIHNNSPEDGTDFYSYTKRRQSRLRYAMLHETIHALTSMRHRTEFGSVMNAETERPALSPMDEALLRLYGNILVRPGMTLARVNGLIVFDDELLDGPDPDPQLAAWKLVKKAYDTFWFIETAHYSVRSSSNGCVSDFGWADYNVGNLTEFSGRVSQVEADNGSGGSLYRIEYEQGAVEHWRLQRSEWDLLSEDEYLEATSGWRNDLSDPYLLLATVLEFADWSGAVLAYDADGLARLTLDVPLGPGMGDLERQHAKVSLLIDPEGFPLVEYAASWVLSSSGCDSYRVEARDGEFGSEIELPPALAHGLAVSDGCEIDLGSIVDPATVHRPWARECTPVADIHRADAFSRSFRFSVEDWSVVRAEVKSNVASDVYLSSRIAEPPPAIANRQGEAGMDVWVHRLVSPGTYTLDVLSDRETTPHSFTMSVSASPVPPPPHRFKHIVAAGRHTCGLLEDGTPVCWGWNEQGQTSSPAGEQFVDLDQSVEVTCGLRPDDTVVCWGSDRAGGHVTPPANERFTSISSGFGYTCGLRENGTAACWGRNDSGKATPPPGEVFIQINSGVSHACGLRPNGTAVCWGSDEYGKAIPPAGERFVFISAGEEHTCGLREDGTVACWGGGGNRLCFARPDGSEVCAVDESAEGGPPTPPEGEVFASLSSAEPVCGLRPDGSAVCWGTNAFGQASPPEDERFTSISSSGSHTCGIRLDGSVTCWGWDMFGQASPPLTR